MTGGDDDCCGGSETVGGMCHERRGGDAVEAVHAEPGTAQHCHGVLGETTAVGASVVPDLDPTATPAVAREVVGESPGGADHDGAVHPSRSRPHLAADSCRAEIERNHAGGETCFVADIDQRLQLGAGGRIRIAGNPDAGGSRHRRHPNHSVLGDEVGHGSVVQLARELVDHQCSGRYADDQGVRPQQLQEAVIVPASPPQTDSATVERQPGDERHVDLGGVDLRGSGLRLREPENMALSGSIKRVDRERSMLGGARE